MTRNLPRSVATAFGLEKTITVAVQQSEPACGSFIGVYVEHVPNHPSGANWAVKGMKYGRAPRASCDDALQPIISNLQERYLIEPTRLFAQSNVALKTPRSLTMTSPLAAAFDRMIRRSVKF